jgi:hypothetical protein
MAGAGDLLSGLGSVMPSMSGVSTGVLVFVTILAVVIAAAVIGWVVYNNKRYKYICIIFEKDSFGQIHRRVDKGGLFIDPITKKGLFFMKHNKRVGLRPDNIPFIQGEKATFVYLLRTGLRNYRFIKIDIDDANINFKIGEEDINWFINTVEKAKKTYVLKKWQEMMPMIALIIVGIIALIIVYYLANKFTVVRDAAQALNGAADTLKYIYDLQHNSTASVIVG